ncbi:unnamed protein product [Lactuca saligna]|uniref:LOB domain-containing protein n=1 Tax=Lactuca saligna TaxID=75948 RepID=A0AA35V821_LACSI|nr:unnamed protein product [Lactuca saligna]
MHTASSTLIYYGFFHPPLCTMCCVQVLKKKMHPRINVSKLLNEIAPHQREDAVNSLAYEAEARLKDPVYGCVGAISVLQRQVLRLQKELDATNADLIRFSSNQSILRPSQSSGSSVQNAHVLPHYYGSYSWNNNP